MDEDEKEVEKGTTDFYLACFIEVVWNDDCRIEKAYNGNCTFYFPENVYDEYSGLYYKKKTVVEVLAFKNKLRDMKSRMINN